MRQLISRFIVDERGATAIEYSLIGVLLCLSIMVGASAVGNAVNKLFQYSGGKLNTVAN